MTLGGFENQPVELSEGIFLSYATKISQYAKIPPENNLLLSLFFYLKEWWIEWRLYVQCEGRISIFTELQ